MDFDIFIYSHWQCTKKEYESYKCEKKKKLQKVNDNQGYKIAKLGDLGTFGEPFGKSMKNLSNYGLLRFMHYIKIIG